MDWAAACARLQAPIFAPLATTSAAGKLRILQGGQPVATYDLHPLADVPEAGLFGRLIDDVKLWIH